MFDLLGHWIIHLTFVYQQLPPAVKREAPNAPAKLVAKPWGQWWWWNREGTGRLDEYPEPGGHETDEVFWVVCVCLLCICCSVFLLSVLVATRKTVRVFLWTQGGYMVVGFLFMVMFGLIQTTLSLVNNRHFLSTLNAVVRLLSLALPICFFLICLRVVCRCSFS